MDANLKSLACSFSGCDGGNINADILLCDIEWGAASRDGYYEKDLPEEIFHEFAKLEERYKKFDWSESIKYPYGISFVKLFTSINGEEVESYREYVPDLNGSELFETNLYPLAFDSTDHALWHEYKLDNIAALKISICLIPGVSLIAFNSSLI